MTEAEWLATTETEELIDFLTKNWVRGHPSKRKSRLFEVGSCRRVEALLMDQRSRLALAIIERHADGLASAEELSFARQEASVSGGPGANPGDEASAELICHWDAANAVWRATGIQIVFRAPGVARRAVANATWAEVGRPEPEVRTSYLNEHAYQANLLRDIFGNPFRPVTINSSWLTSTVLALAQQMYDSRDFSPMPILADALQDAGCDNEEILNHCRQPGEHVKGCFVVDLLLGKT